MWNQLLARPLDKSPAEVVRWLGAVQAQDYPAAKWAVGQRTQTASNAAVEQAYQDGTILRTHILRPTWHFVTQADLRWMLDLTAPRIKTAVAYYYRKLGLDQSTLSRGNAIIEKALQGGKHLTRTEIDPLFVQAGIISATDEPLRSLYVIGSAELEGIVCSGTPRGKQHTYALITERAPNALVLEREEALAELARRYFTSRGPATLKDYIWWSGLSGANAKAGLEMIKPELVEEVVDGQSYWLAPSAQPNAQASVPAVHLLPNYDEYIVGYADRSAMFDPARIKKVDSRGNLLFNHTIVINGQAAGTWKRTVRKDGVEITPNLFTPLAQAEEQALAAAMARYSQFLGMPMLEAHPG